jgi:hypothetical protein
VGKALRAFAGAGRSAVAGIRPSTGAGRGAVAGVVERFTRREVTGWVAVTPDTSPVRVDLVVGDLVLASTYATHGPRSAGTRNGREEVRAFAFRVRDMWPFLARFTQVTVQVDGNRLPIAGHGMNVRPRRNGERTLDELRTLLDSGHVLTHHGRIQLSRRLDSEWQDGVMDLYTRVRAVLHEDFGLEAFLCYGTLLGAVREGGYLDHDADFDTAYVSRRTSAAEATAELVDVALALVRHGFHVEAHPAKLRISDRGGSHRIDLFHTYFDVEAVLRLPFGVAGTATITDAEWKGVQEVEWPGGKALLPVNAEQLAEHIYGEDWRVPKQGFVWRLDKTASAPEAELTTEQRTKIYWASFYAQTHYTSGSTFFEFVSGWEGIPDNVIDIGCGDGRDSCAFGATGRHVLGVDQSPVGIENASQQAEKRGLAERVSFRTCDVADVADLGRAMDEITQRTEGPVAFYMRFFLHAIPEGVQRGLMHAIDTHARPGDYLVAEFRTDKDAENTKVHTKHYRRFQNAEAFRASLGEHGFEVLHFEENSGLSPYKGEDPVLCRAVARRWPV